MLNTVQRPIMNKVKYDLVAVCKTLSHKAAKNLDILLEPKCVLFWRFKRLFALQALTNTKKDKT